MTDDTACGQEMPRYKCHKVVWALKIKSIEYNADTGGANIIPEDDGYASFPVDQDYLKKHSPESGGYYVVYKGGYKSFSPADAFESGYTCEQLNSNMSFGQAIEAMKNGGKAVRLGWNGKGMFIFLVPGSTFNVSRAPLLGIYPEGTEINYHAHIDMKTATGEIVPWLASQSDMLANDWMIID